MVAKSAKEIDLVIPTDEDVEEFVAVEEVKEAPLVTVTPMRDFHTRIAGEWMNFYAEKPVKVTKFVESMLRKDKTKLYR